MKNTLNIRLTEAAVFLRTNENNARRRGSTTDLADSRPSMLRGLLTLNIGLDHNTLLGDGLRSQVKPIKVTSIDLELQAKTSTSWPEGIGARRVDVLEDHKVFSESTVYFRAGPAPRRPASVGPGVHPSHDDELDPPSRPETPRHDELRPSRSVHAARRVSADYSYFHNHDAYEHASQTQAVPPSYTPLPTPPSSSSHTSPAHSSGHLTRVEEDPANALEDFRNALRAGLSSPRTARGDQSPAGSSYREFDRSLSRRPSIETLAEADEDETHHEAIQGSSSPNRGDARGRRARFSLASVSSVIRDAVRPSSPKTRTSTERDESTRRGRPREKGGPQEEAGPSKERASTLAQLVGLKDSGKDREEADSWKEFKKGTYTFPISFAIPANAPPTMECPYGTVVWRLKANVHRPGTFASRMSAAREVIVLAAPMEDDTEESESIVVERHWEQQLQYLISISGRSFPIGGVVPVTFTLMPMAKAKIHRLAIFLEEKVDYYSHFKRLARSDPVIRFQLLSIKHDEKKGGPILPLESNHADALANSPLLALTVPGDDLSQLASEWMGPGPWTFHQELQLPPSCNLIHFTNKNKKSNMTVTHVLKCVIRVERGDDVALDPKTGKRKLFDIVVQTPVHILSCRCSPQWMSLPQYSTSFEDPESVAPNCPCEVQRRGGLERVPTHHSSDSAVSPAETSPVPAAMSLRPAADTLFARNTLFERLVSGQESEAGEAPPAYDS